MTRHIHALRHAFTGWLRRRHGRRELEKLDDYLLADMGITRGDIANVVHGAKHR
jgi:uncharacterized protein YjiS (DUF1127 family)